MKTPHTLLAFLLLASCLSAQEPEEQKIPHYFPKGSLSETNDDYVQDWYARHLKAMDEKPLTDAANDKEAVIYRFTVLPTFDHPYVVKIMKTRGKFIMQRKLQGGKGGYEAAPIKEYSRSEMKDEKPAELDKLLDAMKFQDMPSRTKETGADGSRWILEVVKDGRYHFIDRWSPKEDDPMTKIRNWFIEAARWSPPPAS